MKQHVCSVEEAKMTNRKNLFITLHFACISPPHGPMCGFGKLAESNLKLDVPVCYRYLSVFCYFKSNFKMSVENN